MKNVVSTLLVITAILLVAIAAFAIYEAYNPRFDAEYVGAEPCGECHTNIYPEWKRSPHANMTRRASADSVVGNFDDYAYYLPASARRNAIDNEPVARMHHKDNRWFMDLRQPNGAAFKTFQIEYVIGYQYRQVYLTREPGGVLRRLPLQWSVSRQEYFPYWNLQEGSTPSAADFAAQMTSMNSAWNLFCARCHTTKLEVIEKDTYHTQAVTQWVDDGIACEACHGPGSLHVDYFKGNYANRVAAWLNSKIAGRPVAYIANATKLDKGRAMSVCARCHGPDILMSTTDIYRIYEPGYSLEGRTNDISHFFQSTPLTPNREVPTVETYADGEPKGIGMVFRSLIESVCYQQSEIRCYDCHDPHDNKQASSPGMLTASRESNEYCLNCHTDLQDELAVHTDHEPNTEGSYCYDCHLPKIITKLGGGELEYARTHRLSYIPERSLDIANKPNMALNACQHCHQASVEQESSALAALPD
ncbi:MAG: cytochrome c3 family protein [Gammaproteobacteria bacterium]|nr:cytochrome c3 family protein [Gammaproteobacteria bacterium]